MTMSAEPRQALRAFYEGRRVVVTGATGLLGSHVAEALIDAGARVRLVVHKRPRAARDPNAEVVKADVTQAADCARVMAGMDMAFLCAAVTVGAAQAVKNPVVAVTSNLIMGAQSLQAACFARVKQVLLVSSTSVYPPYPRPVREEEAFLEEPHPAYQGVGHMKRYMEHLAHFYRDKYGMQIAIVRPVPFYGRHDNFDFETCHVIPALIRKAVEKHVPFEVWGSGNDVRDFLHVSDVARGCLLAASRYAVCDGVNLGCGCGVSIRQLAETITRLAGHREPLAFEASKPSTIPTRLVDVQKAQRTIGFVPAVSLEEGLADAIQWFAANREQAVHVTSPIYEGAAVDA